MNTYLYIPKDDNTLRFINELTKPTRLLNKNPNYLSDLKSHFEIPKYISTFAMNKTFWEDTACIVYIGRLYRHIQGVTPMSYAGIHQLAIAEWLNIPLVYINNDTDFISNVYEKKKDNCYLVSSNNTHLLANNINKNKKVRIFCSDVDSKVIDVFKVFREL